MLGILTKTKIGTRINVMTVLLALGMGGVLYVSTIMINDLLWKAYADRTESIVDIGKTLVKEYAQRAANNELSLEEAKAQALKRLSSLRYDGDNYYWVNDMQGIMLMHPTSPKLVGTDVRLLKDGDGKMFFSGMIDLVRKEGRGVYHYKWPANETAKPKVSYVVSIPEWEWIIGTGIYADQIQQEVKSVEKKLGMTVAGFLLIGIMIAFFISRSITKPIHDISGIMSELANGNLDVKVGMQNRVDEIGDMAKTVGIFQENARQVEKLKSNQMDMEKRTVKEKKEAMNLLANDFESTIGKIVGVVSSASTELQISAKNLSEMAEQTSEQTAVVAAATEEASSSIQTVASAAEELSASIGEINRQIEESTRVAASAVDEVKKTDKTVSSLSEAATQIGDVVKLIQDIAEQTNLLALNATIEAARAGEAGKGFAVVASEVKSLANQTGRATEEISKKIITVQNVSTESVSAIRSIGKIIEQIDQITKTIAQALCQQDTATREISNNVQQASAGTSEISTSIVNVTHAAKESRSASNEVFDAANELSVQSKALHGQIESFMHKIRNQ